MATAPQRTTKQSQTRDRVVDLIEGLGVGDAIPSERQLSVDLGVSRLTRPRRARRARARGLPRPPARQRHVRARAEDRAGADDDLVQRGHAPARDAPGQPDALARRRRSPAPTSAAACTSRRPRRSSSRSACASPTARRWRSRRSTCPSRSCPGSRRKDLDDRLLLRAALGAVRNRRSSAASRRSSRRSRTRRSRARSACRCTRPPSCSSARPASETGDDRRVRPLDLPRRPLPARHRAQPARADRVRRRSSSARATDTAERVTPGWAAAGPGDVFLARDPRAAGGARAPARARAASSRPSPRRLRGNGPDARAHGRPRLLGQRGVLRRLRLRPAAGLDGAARLDLALRLLRRRARPARLLRGRALAIGPHPRRASTTCERARARGALTVAVTNDPAPRSPRPRGSSCRSRRPRARRRRDEDVHDPGRRARAPRRLRRRRGPAARRRESARPRSCWRSCCRPSSAASRSSPSRSRSSAACS